MSPTSTTTSLAIKLSKRNNYFFFFFFHITISDENQASLDGIHIFFFFDKKFKDAFSHMILGRFFKTGINVTHDYI